MGAFLGLFIIFLVVELLLLAFSIGISYLLRKVVPSLDHGMAILISLVSALASILIVAKLASTVGDDTATTNEEEEEEDNDDDDDGDDERDLQGRRLKGGVYSFDRFARRKRRKRRK